MLALPVVGGELGPQYGLDNNAAFTTIDGHDHSSGKGVPVTPLGMDINIDLAINGNNLTLVDTVNFAANAAPLSGIAPNLGCIYVAGNELYYNDEAGNVVAITNNGSVNAGAGSITGLPSGTASASYNSGSATFIWQSATSTAANMDAGSYIFRQVLASAKGITVSSPNSLAADYGLVWPTGLPAAQKFMTLDSSGNIAAPWAVDNSTLEISAGTTVQVKDGGITQAKMTLRNQQVLTVPVGGIGVGNSSGAYSNGLTTYVDITNHVITITTLGNPVVIECVGDGSGNVSTFDSNSVSDPVVRITRDATILAQYAGSVTMPVTVARIVDNPTAGTYTYHVQLKISGSGTAFCNYSRLIVYELK